MRRRNPLYIAIGSVLAFLSALALPAFADPTPGFRQDWPGTDLHGWTGGSHYVNPGSGGTLGPGDGYLDMFTESNAFLAAFCSCPEFQGDWQAAGITAVKFSINDINADQNLEIHFVIGGSSSLWLYTPGFVPPEQGWDEFIVDMTAASSFTRIVGSDSFESALQNVELLHIRHDLPPFAQAPDPIQADVGIDGLELIGPSVGVREMPDWGAVELLPPFPNPTRGPVTFSFRASDRGPVELEVVDVAGRVIRSVELEVSAGPNLWVWDGRDDVGRAVSPGVYRARIRGSGGGMSRPLIRVP